MGCVIDNTSGGYAEGFPGFPWKCLWILPPAPGSSIAPGLLACSSTIKLALSNISSIVYFLCVCLYMSAGDGLLSILRRLAAHCHYRHHLDLVCELLQPQPVNESETGQSN